MNECVFCKIVKGEAPCYKIWEDEKFFAILDIYPSTKGMTLVLTKEHYDADAFEMPDDIYQELMLAGKTVSKILKRGLGVQRVVMVMEGMGVNHAHIKLYPLYELKEGGISTASGPQADFEELKQLAEKLRNS